MKETVTSAAAAALAELLEVLPQVDTAVILERDGGSLVACAPETSDRTAEQLGTLCVRILDAAEQSRRELGREPVSRVEVGTPDGHVFVVNDPTWIVAAVTDADPTVGLVFYDMKTALRAVREAAEGAGTTSGNGAAPVTLVTSTGDDDAAAAPSGTSTEDVAEDEATEPASAATRPAESGSNGSSVGRRWRRRNR